jgi:hypothetical protein
MITGFPHRKTFEFEVWAVNAFAGAGDTKRPARLLSRSVWPYVREATRGPATLRYNCIAWAAGDNTKWYDGSIYWPPHVRHSTSINGLARLFASLGYEKADNGRLEPEYLKVTLYGSRDRWFHAAIQTPSGLWQSKDGGGILFEHHTAYGSGYGAPSIFMRRPRDANLPPIFAGKRAIRNVAEKTASGAPIGAPVTAEDPEGDTLTGLAAFVRKCRVYREGTLRRRYYPRRLRAGHPDRRPGYL